MVRAVLPCSAVIPATRHIGVVDDPKPRRDPPWPLRIPKEWRPEIEAAAQRRGVTSHAFLVKAIRRVLDGEPKPAEVSPNFKKGGKK